MATEPSKGKKEDLGPYYRGPHYDERNYLCPTCPLIVDGYRRLVDHHGLIHGKPLPDSYVEKCNVCGEQFYNRWTFKQHRSLECLGRMSIQTMVDECPCHALSMKCPGCNQQLVISKIYPSCRTHIHEAQYFSCPICHYSSQLLVRISTK